MTINPKYAVLYPETFVDARVVTSTESGVEVAGYSGLGPFAIRLLDLATSQNPNTTVRVSAEGASEVVAARTLARRDYGESDRLDVFANSSMHITLKSDIGAGNIANQIVRHSLLCTKLTVYEKLKYKVPLTADELELDAQFGISTKMLAGTMNVFDSTKFTQIKEYATSLSVAAGTVDTLIGRDLVATQGNKVVLLGISADPPLAPNTVFIKVDRDANDELQRWDVFALPPVAFIQECYIPAVNRIKITLDNTPAVVNQRVRYIYGIAQLTLLDKLRWGEDLDEDELATIDEYDLENVVKAGVF